VRRALFALLVLSFATACAQRGRPSVEPPPEPAPPGAAAVGVARSLIGAPYLNGGTTPDGFDCSGFVRYVFGELGIALPRGVREQASLGEPVDREQLRPGDLVFFAIDGHTISHVGIAVSADSFIHAPSSHGRVREESLAIPYWRTRFARARRIGGGPQLPRLDAQSGDTR
jgi:cell wall-associated NlpC family hydrolase